MYLNENVYFFVQFHVPFVGLVAQLAYRLTTSWTFRDRIPEVDIFRNCPDRPWVPPNLLYNGYRVFLGVKSGRGVTLSPHYLLVPWSRKSRTILLPPYGPYVQHKASVPVKWCILVSHLRSFRGRKRLL